MAWGERHHYWRGSKACDSAKRGRAQRRIGLGPCEVCGSERTERHHLDGNLDNCDPENIAILCRKHHMEADGRMTVLRERNQARARSCPVSSARGRRRRTAARTGYADAARPVTSV